MTEYWQATMAALDSPASNGFYALLVLLVLSAVSLLLQRSSGNGGVPAAINRGLLGLMGLRLIQLPLVALGLFRSPTMLKWLPALERGVHMASVVVIGWLWLSAKRGRATGGLKWSIGLALFATAIMMLLWRVAPDEIAFNYTDLDYGWGILTGLAVLGALIIVLNRRERHWKAGASLFAVLLVGQVLHMLVAEPLGDFPLLVQAATLLALPFLYQVPMYDAEPQPAVEEAEEETAQADEDPDFDYFSELFDEDASGPTISEAELTITWEDCVALSREFVETMEADACALAVMDAQAQRLAVQCGYRSDSGEELLAVEIALSDLPRLASGLQRAQGTRLAGATRHQDIEVLRVALGLDAVNYVLAVTLPKVYQQGNLIAILLRANTPWLLDDQRVLESTLPEEREPERMEIEEPGKAVEDIFAWEEETPEAPAFEAQLPKATTIGPFVSDESPIPQLEEPLPHPLQEPEEDLEELKAENEQYRRDVQRLLAHIDRIQRLEEGAEDRLAHQATLINELQRENEELRQAAHSLQSSPMPVGAPSSIDAEQAKEELRLALEQVASLQSRLDAAQQALVESAEGKGVASDKIPADKAEVIASIAQELRQPLSSILGYTDLLLSESVGILGALQRNFLERVRNSTTRMNTLIDNLIHIAELDSAGFTLEPKAVDLGALIDDAISLIRPHLLEKQIILRVDLPTHLPKLSTDRDALQQILFHLLQNADAATPAEGEITLRAFTQQQANLGEFVMLQVSDSGGGIPEDELPRVFSRMYRAKNPVIRGVGDTGVGLTIAETLTEALGGRIWVESEEGVGATFSVLMPLEQGQIQLS